MQRAAIELFGFVVQLGPFDLVEELPETFNAS
jgi:hypothetical protein